MISIIVCSIKPDLLRSFKANVVETIGVPFEFIVIDNNKEQFSICKAYNVGAEQAKYNILAFCHEDIFFHTKNWGKELIKTLSISSIGLVGVAGATFKSKYPLSWVSIDGSCYRSNAFFDKPKDIKNKNIDTLAEVAVLDGMFLGTRRDVWAKNKFNEKELKGFHLYDIDISYQLFKAGYKIVVDYHISIQHLSQGSLDINWFKSSINWHKNKKLPIYSLDYSDNEINSFEKDCQIKFLNLLIKFKIDTKNWINEYIIACKNTKSFHFGILIRIIKGWFNLINLKIKKSIGPLKKDILNRLLSSRVHNNSICIISNNCWAGDIYEVLNKKYNTPFIGLFINAPCYIKLLNDLSFYLNSELKFIESSKYPISNIKYPIGILNDDVEIHFLHYKTKEEAFGKWNRRISRMPKDINNYHYKMDDRDFGTEQEILAFHNLAFPNKISFTKKKYNFKNNLKLKSEEDLILLYTTYGLTDLSVYLNTGIVRNTLFNKVVSSVLKYPSKWL
ncbi:DUF1919 domain-containing protein [Formosa algae]|uniref:DUF1919 domain-containing protein n=1 Tax=Formosa algae TaxID=225843 RepID=UPI000CCFA5FA|nr:DUF1919 domain-containing protein [Formosa algae]PNW26872.1 hypothetical protein BKP44_15440 [Formosa algae]